MNEELTKLPSGMKVYTFFNYKVVAHDIFPYINERPHKIFTLEEFHIKIDHKTT